MMLESDIGVFPPLGFGFTGSASGRATITAIARLLVGLDVRGISSPGGGADIAPSAMEARIPMISFEADESKYFVIHHTAADTVDKIDATDVAKSAAAIAVMTYIDADLPQRLDEPFSTR